MKFKNSLLSNILHKILLATLLFFCLPVLLVLVTHIKHAHNRQDLSVGVLWATALAETGFYRLFSCKNPGSCCPSATLHLCPVTPDSTGFKAPSDVLHHQLGKWHHAVAGSKLSVWCAGEFANVLASRPNGSNSCRAQTAACLSAVAVIWTFLLYLFTIFYKVCPSIPLLYLM